MKNKIYLFLFALIVACSFNANAQTDLSPTDTLANAVRTLKSNLDFLNRLKIGGYIQAQAQFASSSGISSFAGGNFFNTVNNGFSSTNYGYDKRFMIRRGRLKFTYDNGANTSQMLFEVDLTERGIVLIEGNLTAKEHWLNTFSIKGGVFNRPFGYELPTTSSIRESPERGRMSQILFPGERDLGFQFTVQPPKTSPLQIFTVNIAMMNGTGRNLSEFDYQKNLIGQLRFSRSNLKENFKISGGVSYFNGGFEMYGVNGYKMGTMTSGAKGFVRDSSDYHKGSIMPQVYEGGDLEISFITKLGVTGIRGEYIQGTQSGSSSSSTSPLAPITKNTFSFNTTGNLVSSSVADQNAYVRPFNGMYFYLTQNIGKTPVSLVFKYDWYDANTNVSGNEIMKSDTSGKSTGLTSGDLRYDTKGFGLIYRWDANLKFMFYYDLVKNESTQLTGWTSDVSDNVFTLRMQYKF